MNDALTAHDAIMRSLMRIFNGYEVKTEGDAFMVAFFNPNDAVAWCINVQRALLACPWPTALHSHPSSLRIVSVDDPSKDVFAGLRVRMGVHCGEPSCRRNPVTGRMDYFGPVVNRAARVADRYILSAQLKWTDYTFSRKKLRRTAVPHIFYLSYNFIFLQCSWWPDCVHTTCCRSLARVCCGVSTDNDASGKHER